MIVRVVLLMVLLAWIPSLRATSLRVPGLRAFNRF